MGMAALRFGLTTVFRAGTEYKKYDNSIVNYSEKKFLREFRLRKTDENYWCVLLQNDFKQSECTNCNLTELQKVLVSLKILASSESFQNSSKDCLNGVSQATVINCLKAFVNSLNKKGSQFVYLSQSTTAELQIKQEFHRIASFLAVLVCIERTHVSII